MHIPGHLAVALIQHTLPPFFKRKEALLPLLTTAILPDAVDKTIGYVFNAMPNGRHYAHNIFGLIGSSLFVTVIWNKFVGIAWFMGYLGHLVVDNVKRVPWFFPAKDYPFRQKKFHFGWIRFLREMVFFVFVLAGYLFIFKTKTGRLFN